MTRNEMQRLLDREGIHLTKSMGQNFLHDPNQVARILSLADLSSEDRVLEIGPGLGPLTEGLLGHSGEVCAVELDARLITLLTKRFPHEDHLRLVHADALAWLKQQAGDWSDWKLVSNLPYSVASPILVELALCRHPPKRMVAMVQGEVADRIMASPGTSEYGVLTVLLGARFEAIERISVPRTCFFPIPKVDSAVVVLRRRSTPLISDSLLPVYVRLVKLGFHQRRKMFAKLLRANWSREQVEAVFRQTDIACTIRAEKLAFEQFARLAVAFSKLEGGVDGIG